MGSPRDDHSNNANGAQLVNTLMSQLASLKSEIDQLRETVAKQRTCDVTAQVLSQDKKS